MQDLSDLYPMVIGIGINPFQGILDAKVTSLVAGERRERDNDKGRAPIWTSSPFRRGGGGGNAFNSSSREYLLPDTFKNGDEIRRGFVVNRKAKVLWLCPLQLADRSQSLGSSWPLAPYSRPLIGRPPTNNVGNFPGDDKTIIDGAGGNDLHTHNHRPARWPLCELCSRFFCLRHLSRSQ